ncbi:titin-like [Arapaima gigas]
MVGFFYTPEPGQNMGAKLSKRKKGYNVSDPKAQEEGTPGNQVQEKTEEASEKELKSESKPENVSSTAIETGPSEKSTSEVPVENVAKAIGVLPEAPRETAQEEEMKGPMAELRPSQDAPQEPNSADPSAKVVISSSTMDTAPVKEKAGACKSREEAIPSFLCVSQLPQADIQEISGKAEGPDAFSTPGKVPEEISSAISYEGGGSSTNAPEHKDKMCPVPATLEGEPEGVAQDQREVTEVLPKKSAVEISQILEPDSGPAEQPTGDTGSLELPPAEVPPPAPECPSEVTVVTADVSQQQDSHTSALDTAPDAEDITVDSPEGQVKEHEEKPNPSEPTLPQGKTVENAEMPCVLHTETEVLVKPERSSKSPKDTETEGVSINAADPELSSVKELLADEKMEIAGTEKIVAENLTDAKATVEGPEKVLDLSIDAEVKTDAEAIAVPGKDASPTEEEEHKECANSAGQATGDLVSKQTAEKPTEPQQECVNGINEPEEPPKSATATNGCDHQKDVDLIGSLNAPVCETQDVISPAQVELV